MKIMKLLSAILWGVISIWYIPVCEGAVQKIVNSNSIENELPVILRAAARNKCMGDDFLLLLAIRKSENGGSGREFGILHPKCLAAIRKYPERGLELQAGWAAATIMKNRKRWQRDVRPGDFISYLADRYCPSASDSEGNRNFKRNVTYFFKKFKDEYHVITG